MNYMKRTRNYLNTNTDIEIRRCRELTKHNIDDIIRISEETLGKNYLIVEDLTHPSYRWVIATCGKRVVGFSSFINGHTDAKITDVAVDGDFQGNGIATRLIAQCVFEISLLWVEVIECFAWETNNYPHLEKPLVRNGFKRIGTENRGCEDYRDNFECPVCGIDCVCNTVLFRKTLKFDNLIDINK